LVLGGGTVGLLFALGIFGGGKEKSVAHEHLPKACQAVVRVDIKGILKTKPVKEHVVPEIEDKAKESKDADKLAKFLITAELDPKKDLKEMVICFTDLDAKEPSFVAVIGGDLKKDGVVNALEKHGKKDEFKAPKEEDGLRVIEAKDEEIFITQSNKDAALLFGNKLELIKKAAKSGDDFKGYDIPLDEQFVGIITEDAVKELSNKAGAQNPLGDKMKNAGRMIVTASLDTGKVEARLGMPDEAAAKELVDGLKGLLDLVKDSPGADAEAKEVMSSASIEAKGKEVVVKLTIPKKMIEEGAKEVAKGIRKADEDL
jgi:hypothetical protein